ncbi:uncharacterized protein Triagg1_9155 [Trichoderma aggressivum f. europaeum]|uniref:aldehyde dehydrogenase (NAD(+)) n=1 Tax=Trichoderma aggressivum f. europaeum TaxID=173218 RepID=A0AAE1I7F5_9HYPO|nr:hypothetical protein Triagg1_9155 [Trichoderma aggressivum f. europaeum]
MASGSTAGGLAMREAVADGIVPVNLELGGNDPAYVRPHADLACCAVERIYVHQDVHDQFVKALQDELKDYVVIYEYDSHADESLLNFDPGTPLTINAQISDALTKGAVNATPENMSFTSAFKDGNFVAPILLTNVTHDMQVMREETFGPVIPVAKVKDDDEAVRLMNDTEYGLTASVWTKDIARGEELIELLEAGTVFVNRCDYPNPDLAWTGWKRSGLGCTLGPRGYDAFVKLKSYHVKEKQG